MSQPTVTPVTTVLELSQRDADIVHQNVNGDYTVHFAEPITLKPGDSMNLRMASIDSQKATSESIVIPGGEGDAGLPVSIAFSYFDRNYELVTPGTAAPGPAPVDATLEKKKFDVTPAVKYEPDYEFYSTFVEPEVNELVSFSMNYQGSPPFRINTNPAEPPNSFVQGFVCYPVFSWIDENGVHRQNSGALGYTESNGGGTSHNLPPLTGKPVWSFGGISKTPDPYAYFGITGNLVGEQSWSDSCKQTCIPYGSLTSQQQQLMTAHTKGWGYGGSGSKKIIFQKNTLKLLGIVSFVVGQSVDADLPIDNQGDAIYQITLNGQSFKSWNVPSNAASVNPQPNPNATKTLYIQTEGTIIPPGRYDRTTLAQVITQGYTEVGFTDAKQVGGDPVFGANTNLQIRMDDAKSLPLLFRKMPDVTDASAGDFRVICNSGNSYQYPNNVNVTVGAREFAIEYGQVGEAFQITKMHQSLNSGLENEKQQEQIATFFTPGTPFQYHELLNSTGIFIHNMEPSGFWDDQLGLFDKTVIPVSTDGSGAVYVNRHEIQDKFTSETAQIQAFSIDNQRGTAAPTATTYFNTTDLPTRSIIGDAPRTNEATGTYYLIEITGLNITQSNFINNETNRGFISAIVSKQYDNNDAITAFQDSAIPYVHRGPAAVKIGSARVRILDPTTGEVVTTLGDQNSVFLQVNSGVETIPLQTQNQVQGSVPK